MKVIEVIPISRGINKEQLSYFTASEVEIGSLITVPLRKRTIPAIVVSLSEVEDIKSEIKNSDFALKKIEKTKSHKLLLKNFIDSANDTSKYFISSVGAVLSSVVPKVILENAEKIKIPENPKKNTRELCEKLVIQAPDEERFANYRSLIREEFARDSSVFFCLPTIQDLKKAVDKLQKGIEKYTFVFHSSLSKKEVIDNINQILAEKHPVLIIATGGFLSIPREDIGTIIVDKENARSYKLQTRPYLDMRFFAERFAEKNKIRIIFGDLLLRAETIYRYRMAELIEVAPLKFRSLSTSTQEMMDMKEIKKIDEDGMEKAEFKVISPKMERLLRENILNNEHLFVFVGRRGLSPSTVCADCGNIVACNSCGSHIVLHKSSVENFFLCHKCGERRSALEKCKNCGGWRLTTLGIGTERVEQEIQEMFPEQKIFQINTDLTPTHKRALAEIEKFYSAPQGILIGTEMALLYLSEKISNSVIVSMDSFFSVPDFRINEKVLNILLKIRSITDKNFLIQTRDAKQKIFEYAMRGNLVDFYKEELEDRKALNYPPFSILIKVNIVGTKTEVMEAVEQLQKSIDPYEIDIFPAFIPQSKGKYAVNGVVKIKKDDWPNENLLSVFKALPLNYTVNVDPESLL
jgi:primosomal protein N' (replication factor Y)